MNMRVEAPTTRDAVMIVPGIMGSELKDKVTRRTLWGLKDPRWYVTAWTTGSSLAALRLTDDERNGKYGRLKATGVLRFPASAPILQGFEPYTELLKGVRNAAVHADAVIEFPYDWRLPVAHNAGLLAEAAHRHLEAWRRHPAQLAARRNDPDDAESKLVIVAHSMGGLLARHLTLIPGAAKNLRAVITIGTPFYGAVKAAVLLNSGRGAPVPLPRVRLRKLATTLPGVYDLLPTDRCVDAGSTARHLSPADVADLGGDRELAEASADSHKRVADQSLPGHVQVVGTQQPTLQSLSLAEGVATGNPYTCRPGVGGTIERIDLTGDGTVARRSAQLPSVAATPLAQSHGAIAKTVETILVVSDALIDQRTGPWLGAGRIGLEVPDIVAADTSFDILVTGVEHPRDAACRLVDVALGRQIRAPRLAFADGRIIARAVAPTSGLYRVEVIGGGASPVSQLVLSCDLPAALRSEARDTF